VVGDHRRHQVLLRIEDGGGALHVRGVRVRVRVSVRVRAWLRVRVRAGARARVGVGLAWKCVPSLPVILPTAPSGARLPSRIAMCPVGFTWG